MENLKIQGQGSDASKLANLDYSLISKENSDQELWIPAACYFIEKEDSGTYVFLWISQNFLSRFVTKYLKTIKLTFFVKNAILDVW